jgi:hypothetical protein
MNILNNIKSLLLNNGLRWTLFVVVLTLNFVAFIQDPIRLSSVNCLNLPCKWFGYIAGMGTFTMDCLTFIGLWLTIPFTYSLPELWFIPFMLIGYAIITQITLDSKIYTKGENAETESLNPPPNYLLPQKRRKLIYMTILVIDIIIFLQFYLASGLQKLSGKARLIDIVFLNRFGGYTGNEISFIIAWIGVIGILFDYIAYNLSSGYTPCKYDQSISWNF